MNDAKNHVGPQVPVGQQSVLFYYNGTSPRPPKVSPDGGSQEKTQPCPHEWKEWEVPVTAETCLCCVPGTVLGATCYFI